MKIAVLGTGYVGLVTGACFSETGNDVVCVDIDEGKINQLQAGEIPFYEPGLSELVNRNVKEGRLVFTDKPDEPLSQAEVIFISVGTPSKEDGSANLTFVYEAAEMAAKQMKPGAILTIKSTVPVGTADALRQHLKENGFGKIKIVSNPEFLREGSAVQDCLFPDRVVIGTNDSSLEAIFQSLYAPFLRTGKPFFLIDNCSAEMTKYASNALLAARISFINEIALLCEKVGADVSKVREAVGADHRIGLEYLFPSIGFGGSCFPKDVKALWSLAKEHGLKPGIFSATLEVNEEQQNAFVHRIVNYYQENNETKKTPVAIWGLSFKAKTDDIRESPALRVIDGLLEANLAIRVYDPVAMPNVRATYENRIEYASSSYDAVKGASSLIVLTEWNQFRRPDFLRIKNELKQPIIFDGRNLYDPNELKKLGFKYFSIGRPDIT